MLSSEMRCSIHAATCSILIFLLKLESTFLGGNQIYTALFKRRNVRIWK
uniref:Uncharacterized protein n=1 Tax=Manihot esculenta TaxID=3983 RepID=A0A2C9V0W9_MANES